MFEPSDVGYDRGNNFGRSRSSGLDRGTAPAPAGARVYTMPYIVFRIHAHVLFSISSQCSFAICTRFSLVHDEPKKHFKHARSLFLYTDAFFIQNIETILCEN